MSMYIHRLQPVVLLQPSIAESLISTSLNQFVDSPSYIFFNLYIMINSNRKIQSQKVVYFLSFILSILNNNEI